MSTPIEVALGIGAFVAVGALAIITGNGGRLIVRIHASATWRLLDSDDDCRIEGYPQCRIGGCHQPVSGLDVHRLGGRAGNGGLRHDAPPAVTDPLSAHSGPTGPISVIAHM